ncbi:MAG: 4'-phosphopantetheinyl transferase superfamily protein [Bdellovibrionaceae bacterium]|nr:4'-phosphopantetheinyl transferase superfamily protein [Pseudobdellovibrionaceae bacterium]
MGRVKRGEALGIPYLLLASSSLGREADLFSIPARNNALCRAFFGEASQKEIRYTSEGRPYLRRVGDLSLSHKNEDFFLCAEKGEGFLVGCDIEDLSQHRSWGTFRKALTTDEVELFSALSERLPKAMALLIPFSWKECLWKAVGLRGNGLRISEVHGTVSGVHAKIFDFDQPVGEVVAWVDDGLLMSLCKLELS